MTNIELNNKLGGKLGATPDSGLNYPIYDYEGDTNLLVISRDTRTEYEKVSKIDVALRLVVILSITILLGVGLEKYTSEIVSIVVMLVGLLFSVKGVSRILNVDAPYTKAKSIQPKGKGKIVGVREEDLNNIVKLKNDEIKRVYQLISDDDIINNLEIKTGEIITNYLPVRLLENEITHIIPQNKDTEGMTMEERAIYNIGNTIPKISEEDKDSIISALERVYKHKTDVENGEEYSKVYTKLLDKNKNVDFKIPTLEGSQEYLRKELGIINLKLGKELETNKEIVEIKK